MLFVRLRSIGDTVLLTATLQTLKRFRPEVEIAVALEPYSAPLLQNHPLVDKLLTVPSSTSDRIKFVFECRRARFDVALNVHGGPTSNLITAFSGARYTAGYGDYRYSSLLKRRAPGPDSILGRNRIHSLEQQLALLAWTGVPWPDSRATLQLAVSEEASSAVTARLKAAGAATSGFAIIAPAAAAEPKRWSAQGFADVADHLRDYWRMPSVVIAGPGQETIAEQVVSASRTAPPVITGLTLTELVALTSMTSLFVCNDSGPMHIAAALGRPIVAIFGSSDPNVWHPWTEAPYRILEPPREAGPGNGISRIPERLVLASADEVVEAALSAGLT